MNKQLRVISAAGVAAGILGVSGVASAQSPEPCSVVLSNFQSCGGTASCESLYVSEHPECFGGSSTTSSVQINATTFALAGAISQALSSRIRQAGQGPVAAVEGQSGLAAGGSSQAWNAWAHYSGNASRVSYTNTLATTTRSDSNVDTAIIGGDYALSPKMALGLSVGFDRGSGSGGVVGAPNSTGSNGYVIAPYLGYQLSKDLALDVSAGWGEGEFSSGAVKADAKRWFASGNLSYSQWMANWQLTSKLSFLHGEEKYEDSKSAGATVVGTGSKNTVDQARVGVRAGYWMNGFMPYAGLVYASDIRRSTSKAAGVDPLGRGAFVWSVGADFFSLASKMTGGIAYEQESGRTNSKNEKLMANINVRF